MGVLTGVTARAWHRVSVKKLHTPRMFAEGKDGEKGWLGSAGGLVHTAVFKMENQQGLPVETGNSAQRYVAAWVGGF